MSLLNHPLVKSWMAVERKYAAQVEPEKETTKNVTVQLPLPKPFRL